MSNHCCSSFSLGIEGQLEYHLILVSLIDHFLSSDFALCQIFDQSDLCDISSGFLGSSVLICLNNGGRVVNYGL